MGPIIDPNWQQGLFIGVSGLIAREKIENFQASIRW
jgi:hypothetical protein